MLKMMYYHSFNEAKMSPMLMLHDDDKLVLAFITSRLEYCNILITCPAAASSPGKEVWK